jgi:hypothetical protein
MIPRHLQLCVRDGAEYFKDSHGMRDSFSTNLRASPFNVDLSIDTAFRQVRLAGQYRLKYVRDYIVLIKRK